MPVRPRFTLRPFRRYRLTIQLPITKWSLKMPITTITITDISKWPDGHYPSSMKSRYSTISCKISSSVPLITSTTKQPHQQKKMIVFASVRCASSSSGPSGFPVKRKSCFFLFYFVPFRSTPKSSAVFVCCCRRRFFRFVTVLRFFSLSLSSLPPTALPVG